MKAKHILAQIILVIFVVVETKFFLIIGDICPELDFLLGQLATIIMTTFTGLVTLKIELERLF